MLRTLQNVFRFYYDGFREMTLGKTLWMIILIKLFLMFVVLRLVFFRPTLPPAADDRAKCVREQLIGDRP